MMRQVRSVLVPLTAIAAGMIVIGNEGVVVVVGLGAITASLIEGIDGSAHA